MAKLRDKLMRGARARAAERPGLAIPRELGRLSFAWLRHSVVGLPLSAMRSLASEPSLSQPLSEARFCELFGENALKLFDDLGPIYGKAGQIVLSRLSPPLHEIAETLRLTRLYKDWPPLPFSDVEALLDAQIPRWRTELTVDAYPLGVASLAQVHAAKGPDGRLWVVKVLKPQAKRRLIESVEALEQLAEWLSPLAVTHVARRGVKELRELCIGFRQEVSLGRERETILKVHQKLQGRRQKLLVIPEVHPDLHAEDVLVVERFLGTSLADIVAGKAPLPTGSRAKLAKSMLAELLVQVFELGLFHADPHAGNLILTDDGNVGLFDWGLAGELLESDRRHIAAILKAVIALDQEALISALVAMGEDAGRQVDRDDVRKELKSVIQMINAGRADPAKKPSLQALFETCLRAAARLGIQVPDGLLLMAKSLITIEGLAKGIDPSVSLGRVATPVLLRAAKPGLKEIVAMGRRLPELVRAVLGR